LKRVVSDFRALNELLRRDDFRGLVQERKLVLRVAEYCMVPIALMVLVGISGDPVVQSPEPVSATAAQADAAGPSSNQAEPHPDGPAVRPAAGLTGAEVARVIDGDTIEARKADGGLLTVRLIGVDTPETVHPSQPVQPYGREASSYTGERLKGERIDLEYDVEREDKYGRTLAYVWLGDELFNATLLEQGYAQLLTIPPNVKYVEHLKVVQQGAREAGRGLWGIASTLPSPADDPVQASVPAKTPAIAAPERGAFAPDRNGNCVENGVRYIKGNRNSMIYHGPSGQFYDRTIAEQCFYTAEDARNAGFRASQR